MTLTAEFCAEYFDKCSGSIDFPSYDGLSYCEKHVGSGNEFWSYPYEEGRNTSYEPRLPPVALVPACREGFPHAKKYIRTAAFVLGALGGCAIDPRPQNAGDVWLQNLGPKILQALYHASVRVSRSPSCARS